MYDTNSFSSLASAMARVKRRGKERELHKRIEQRSGPIYSCVYVCLALARRYRAPELLLGCKRYSSAGDLWSWGCVVSEIFLLRPLLRGDSDISQLGLIAESLGKPERDDFPECSLLDMVQFSCCPVTSVRRQLSGLSESLVSLIESCLQVPIIRKQQQT